MRRMLVGLIDELKTAKAKTGGVPRKIDKALEKLTEPEREALQEALGSPEWSAAGISRALGAAGHPVSVSSVKRYRTDVVGVSFE
jgi:hypothetical protein